MQKWCISLLLRHTSLGAVGSRLTAPKPSTDAGVLRIIEKKKNFFSFRSGFQDTNAEPATPNWVKPIERNHPLPFDWCFARFFHTSRNLLWTTEATAGPTVFILASNPWRRACGRWDPPMSYQIHIVYSLGIAELLCACVTARSRAILRMLYQSLHKTWHQARSLAHSSMFSKSKVRVQRSAVQSVRSKFATMFVCFRPYLKTNPRSSLSMRQPLSQQITPAPSR